MKRKTRADRLRCDACGSPLETIEVRRYGEVLPIAVVLVGSVLAFHIVGLLILPLGAFLWTRKATRPSCPACGGGPAILSDANTLGR